MYFNEVILTGRLTADTEIRFLPSGSQITSFTIAVNRPYKTKDSDEWKTQSYFFDVEVFGALAERIGKELNKGNLVLIEGELRQDAWTDKEGKNRRKVKIVANKVINLSKAQPVKDESKEEGLVTPEGVEDEIDDVPF